MKKIILFFATGGGVGYLPKLPGTYGTAVGLFFYLLIHGLSPFNPPPRCFGGQALLGRFPVACHGILAPGVALGFIPVIYFVTVVTFIFFAVWVASFAEIYFGQKDSQKIVIDEIAGYLVTMLFIPFQWKWALAGFLLFRLFDIWKPFPIRKLEHQLKGGWGVVMDDVAAGVYANVILHISIRFL